MRALVCLAFFLFTCSGISGLVLPELDAYRARTSPRAMSWYSRVRRLPRISHRIINPAEDCFLVTSEEGEIFFKSPSNEATVCGIYIIAEPDKKIQVTFNYMDVSCDYGGLVAWVDGWELNGQVWPADSWDDDRVIEFCDQGPRKKIISRQNAALIQYRVPAKGKGFSVTIRHLKNPKPCNVMVFGSQGVYTLRNHGASGNCSLITVSPASVRVLDIDVGQSVNRGNLLNFETGVIHQCFKRGQADYVDIGGATGLDHSKMEVLENLCGLDSTEARHPYLIACEDTVVRLRSSGRYHNSVTLAISPLEPDDIERADLLCGINDA